MVCARLSVMMMVQVLVPIASGTEPMEAVITVDVLRRAGADVSVASVDPGSAQVGGAWGVKLAADALLDDLADAEFDLISLPVSGVARPPRRTARQSSRPVLTVHGCFVFGEPTNWMGENGWF